MPWTLVSTLWKGVEKRKLSWKVKRRRKRKKEMNDACLIDSHITPNAKSFFALVLLQIANKLTGCLHLCEISSGAN